MLPVSELVRVANSVDASGVSPLAARAAAQWGWHEVRFVRSSATHVFAAGRDAARPEAALRILPTWAPSSARQEPAARLGTRLADLGAPVASSVLNRRGRVCALVPDGNEEYVVTASRFIAGESLEIAELSEAQLRTWGRSLARLHRIGSEDVFIRSDVPDWRGTVFADAAASLAGPTAEAGAALSEQLAQLPMTSDAYGFIHGDPETDNLVWQADTATLIDLDDHALSWFAGDALFALRDLAADSGVPDLEDPAVKAFLGGYRDERPLMNDELAWWPLLSRAHGLVMLARLQPVMEEEPQSDWPAWAIRLHARVTDIVIEQTKRLAGSHS